MRSLAIVGSGIAGMGCAYLLRNHYQLTVFEKETRVGGHTNTVLVDEDGQSIPIDTGFMVYNEVTYPNLTRLFAALHVDSKPTDMSFSVQQLGLGFEWSGTGFARLFGDRANILRPRFWRFLFKLDKFNKEALLNVENTEYDQLSVGDYVARLGYGEDFLELYLLPMMSALWSASPKIMLQFPIAALLRFMRSHGLLSVYGQHQWLTVANGAKTYMERLQNALPQRVKSGNAVCAIERMATSCGAVSVTTADGEKHLFDKCVVATHADQALQLLKDCDENERRALSRFQYQENLALLHTHEAVMPKHRSNWASWNYKLEAGESSEAPLQSSTHYWMNNLQNISRKKNYFVSIGGADLIPQSKVLRTISYEHPIFTVEALRAQSQLASLNRRPGQNVLFAGSYFRYGFHEDAFNSALQVSELLGGERGWTQTAS